MSANDTSHSDTDRVPYAKPQPWGMTPDMVIPDVNTDDEKLWALFHQAFGHGLFT